ncbi:MAG: hypothetical protein FWD76_04440 [Firmicutes bacterium]|nr:hypothetical protein [Bacillota bacterium]
MKEIVKSTQGVESAKSTSKQWIARMTKKRWVAVVSLSLCFVFCMSFGLQQAMKTKYDSVGLESRVQTDVQTELETRKVAYDVIKQQMQQAWQQVPRDRKSLNKQSQELLSKYDDQFFEGLFGLLDKNVGAMDIAEYLLSYFEEFEFSQMANSMEEVCANLGIVFEESEVSTRGHVSFSISAEISKSILLGAAAAKVYNIIVLGGLAGLIAIIVPAFTAFMSAIPVVGTIIGVAIGAVIGSLVYSRVQPAFANYFSSIGVNDNYYKWFEWKIFETSGWAVFFNKDIKMNITTLITGLIIGQL